MSEGYRLVFSGEVLEGQHTAVVKKRLAAVLKLDDERLAVLFKGQPVVVKNSVDKKTAAKYQQAFKQAGARLRVIPVSEPEAAKAEQPEQRPLDPKSPTPTPPLPDASLGLSILPAGSDMLRADERTEDDVPSIDTSHLAVQGAVFTTDEDFGPSVDAPNVDHITLAELGAEIGVETGEEHILIEEIDADFDLAEVGAILGALDKAGTPTVDVNSVEFDVAETGADIGEQSTTPPPNPPDTSHLQIDDLNE